ncbi:MAG: HEAT repeat domain-containing protein [Planctomycetota bacterium]|jgi:HEAT repeat protein|nr:HEAT repeat domain-containing protein [Planctomycetota bacterium]
MKTRIGVRMFLPCLALLAAAAAPGGETLTNADVIAMTRAGLTAPLVIAKIQSSLAAFDLSTRGMIALKANGARDEVIQAMMLAAESQAARPRLDADRLRRELWNVAAGGEAEAGGFSWILANREQALPEIVRAMADARPEIRAGAIAALSRLGARENLPAIRHRLTDPSPLTRRAAARALFELDDSASIADAEKAVTRQLTPLDGYARLLGHAKLTRSAGALGMALAACPDPQGRAASAWAIGEIGRAGIAGRPALEKALADDADPLVRREAALALAKFHDARSAAALQDACRRDPGVRKTTLAALADYPEATEFLAGVMNLGAEQISADELETARASLSRLTGEDFGLDGPRWSDWLARSARDRGRAVGAPFSSAPAFDPPAARPEVDIEAWSIVADSAGIPMAPQVDDRRPIAATGGVTLPLPSEFSSGAANNGIFNLDGVGANPFAGNAEPAAPTSAIPALDYSGESAAAPPEASGYRTWSSAFSAPPAAPAPRPKWTEVAAPSDSPPPGPVPGWADQVGGPPSAWSQIRPPAAPADSAAARSETPPALSNFSSLATHSPPVGAPDGSAAEPAAPRPGDSGSALPTAGIVAPIPAEDYSAADSADILRGLSLPMPSDRDSDAPPPTLSNRPPPPSSPKEPPLRSEDATDVFVFPGEAGGAAAVPAASAGDVFSNLEEAILPDALIGDTEGLLETDAGQLSEAAPASPIEPDAEVYPGGGVLFVEPEPGQLVIGEPLIAPGETWPEGGESSPAGIPPGWEGMSFGEAGAEESQTPAEIPPGWDFSEAGDEGTQMPEPPPELPVEAPDFGAASFPPTPEPAPVQRAPDPEPFDPSRGTSLPPVTSEGLVLPDGKGMSPLLGEGLVK